jgi:hypothetical protein
VIRFSIRVSACASCAADSNTDESSRKIPS